MRIIKLPEQSEKTCHKCGCVFTYVDSDIRTDRDGSYIECQSCKALTVARKRIL